MAEIPTTETVGKVEVAITPDMLVMLKQITDAKKITGALARPVWVAACAIITAIVGGTVWWTQQNGYAQDGSPALKAFIKTMTDQQNKDREADNAFKARQIETNTRLTTLAEQFDKRISNIERK